jgi:hypothetical protein
MRDLRNVGGTPGGLGSFVVGFILLCAGAYLLLDRVSVHGGYWSWFGSAQTSFGVTLLPLMVGVGTLFYNGKSWLGWVLVAAFTVVLLTGIIANLQIHFRSTSLFMTLIMLGMIAAGLGGIVRALRSAE